MKRKLISTACILGMVAATMAGCGSKPADSAESKSQTEARLRPIFLTMRSLQMDRF